MSKFKKALSITLALALLVSSVFIGGIFSSAESSVTVTEELFCGFENYAVSRINESAVPSGATIVSDSTSYAGSKHMKLSLTADALSSFEIRDSAGFDTVSGKTYAVTFYYKASAPAKYYVGTAQGNEVAKTAAAIIGGDLAATNAWTKATVNVTIDKGRNEGFVPVMMAESSSAATVEFDNIFFGSTAEDTVTLSSLITKFVDSTDGYPVLSGAKTPGSAANIWDGSTATKPTGSGTEADPYKIATGANLYWAIKNATSPDTCYVLTADIYLNNPVHVNWLTGSVNYGYKVRVWDVATNNVQGHFDGQGYGIYGCYNISVDAGYKTAETAANGYGSSLFGKVPENGSLTVKNLTVDKMYNRYHVGAGGIVGVVGKSATLNLENCSVGREVYLDGSATGGLVAAVGAENAVVNATNCYSLATYYSSTSTDGLIGMPHWTNSPAITFTNCYNANGKIVGVNRNTVTATNCYESVDGPLNTGVTTISADNMKGSDVLTNSAKMSGLGGAYVAHTATFEEANKNVFVRLPEGTYFEQGETYKFNVYDANMAPFDERYVLSSSSYGTLTRGAYFRFKSDFDMSKVHIPASRADEVIFGTAKQLHTEDYFGVRIGTIAANLKNQPEHAVNYLYITDTHFATNTSQHSDAAAARQFELIIEMANELDEIDFVALGGDVVSGNDAVDDDCIAKINTYLAVAKTCTKPVFIIPGNHDDNSYGSIADSMTLEQFADRMLSPDEWQETVVDQYVKRKQADGSYLYDIVQNKDPYNAAKINSKYYYYDLADKNTRLIFLNASDYEYTYDANGNFMPKVKDESVTNARSKSYSGNNFWGYSDYQVKWLAEKALGTLPADYNVMFFSHMRLDNEPRNGGTRTYYNGSVLQGILTAYQNKTAYTNASLGISADYTEETGRIISYQHGHEHSSKTDYYSENGLNMWRLSSTTANPDDDGWKGISGETCRVMNENIGAIDAVSVTEGYILRQSNGIGNLSNVISQNGSGLLFNDFVVQSGDITADGTVDICDLVKLALLNEAELPSVQAKNTNADAIRISIAEALANNIGDADQSCKHSYDNNCDTDCNECGEERVVGGHNYDDDYDADCNSCGAIRQVEERPIEYWDGKISEPTKTDTEGNILITRPSELAYVIKNGGGSNYKLTNDIYLNDITKINWQTGAKLDESYIVRSWYENGNCTQFAGGTIDGNGYVVYGMYFEGNPESYSGHPNAVALIPRLTANASITIKNLGIDNAYVNYNRTAAAFIGTTMGGNTIEITDSYVGENVTLKGGTAAAFRGYAYSSAVVSTVITNCYSLASMTGTSGVGFIATQNDYIAGTKTVKLTNCYNANGPLNSGNNFGSVATATNCYATEIGGTGNQLKSGVTTLLAAQMQGANALTVMPLGDAYTATDSYPVLKVFPVKTPSTDEPETPDEPEEPAGCAHEYDDEYDASCNKCGEKREVPERPIVIWDGTTLTAPNDSNNDGWLEISNGAELAYVVKNGGGADNKYKLVANIYLNNINKVDWKTGEKTDENYTVNSWYNSSTAGKFQGTIDGNGFVVYGVHSVSTGTGAADGAGLIPRTNSANVVTIKNLGVDYSYISAVNSAAAFVGVAYQSGYLTMDSCFAGANVTVKATSYAGAFRGRSNKTNGASITNCYSLASVTASNYGLVAYFYESTGTVIIQNCYNANGPISTHNHTGSAESSNNYVTEAVGLTEGRNVVAVADMQGANALVAMKLGDAYVTTNTYPVLKVFVK